MSNNNIVSNKNSQPKDNTQFGTQSTYSGGVQIELNSDAVEKANRIFSSDKKANNILKTEKLENSQKVEEKNSFDQNKSFFIGKSSTDKIDLNDEKTSEIANPDVIKTSEKKLLFNKEKPVSSDNLIEKVNNDEEKTEAVQSDLDINSLKEKESVVISGKSNDFKKENQNSKEKNSNIGSGVSNKSFPAKKPNLIYLAIFLLLLMSTFGFFYFKFFQKKKAVVAPIKTVEVEKKNIVLEYWGLWETEEAMSPILKDFESENPNISVMYKNNDQKNYFSKINGALSSGQGPDVFRFHNSWVKLFQDNLDVVPSYVYTNDDYKKTFFPVNSSQLEIEGDIYGIPLSHEGLALVYNKQLFKDMNADYPGTGITWTEFKNLAKKMTNRKGGKIVQSGAALGLASNVDNFSDILGTLLFQVGADLSNVDEKYYPQVFDFYTSFYNDSKNRVWDESFESSVMAFTENKVAMILIPSWRIHEIIYRNPSLEFGLTTVPIFAKNDDNVEADAESNAVWASVWSEGVNSNIEPEKKEAAWKLLKFLSSKEVQLKFANMIKEKGYRSFGPIFSRQDLAKVENDEINFAYLNNAMQAQSWYLNSGTHDGELNDQMIGYFASAIDNLNQADHNEVNTYATLQGGINAVLEKYGIAESKE